MKTNVEAFMKLTIKAKFNRLAIGRGFDTESEAQKAAEDWFNKLTVSPA